MLIVSVSYTLLPWKSDFVVLDDMDFNEHILVFDFEPHDSNYSESILMELMEVFSDSTEHGKLYLNYPTVESFKDIRSLDDETSFINSTVTLEIVKRGYKEHVDEKARITQLNHIKKIDKKTGSRLLDLHQQKLTFITKLAKDSNEKYHQLCKKQCEKLKKEKIIWVVNTSILHLLDEYGSMP